MAFVFQHHIVISALKQIHSDAGDVTTRVPLVDQGFAVQDEPVAKISLEHESVGLTLRS